MTKLASQTLLNAQGKEYSMHRERDRPPEVEYEGQLEAQALDRLRRKKAAIEMAA